MELHFTSDFFFGGFSRCTQRETAWYGKGCPLTFQDASHGMTKNDKKEFKKAGICTIIINGCITLHLFIWFISAYIYIYEYTVYRHNIVTAVRVRNRFNLPIWGLESTFLHGFLWLLFMSAGFQVSETWYLTQIVEDSHFYPVIVGPIDKPRTINDSQRTVCLQLMFGIFKIFQEYSPGVCDISIMYCLW